MYCGEVDLSGDNVLCVLYSAKKYMLPGLEKKCQEFLDSRLDVNNVCAVLEQVINNGPSKRKSLPVTHTFSLSHICC